MSRSPSRRRSSYPLDRWATGLMAVLAVVIGVLLLSGDHALARVRDFTWGNRQVGTEDRAFLLTFSRPMDTASVEKNLKVSPPLPGKISWAGRRMAYTLEVPAPYGETFTVSLDQAQDLFAKQEQRQSSFVAFQSTFSTRNRGFAYIGTEGEEAGRLVLADLTRQDQQILTSKDLVVLAFKPYPLGDRILFAATDAAAYREGQLDQKLYTVTTGLNPHPPEALGTSARLALLQLFQRPPQRQPAGQLKLVLDSDGYQNLKFDLSPDGQTIVVQRVNRDNPADFGPWLVREGEAPQLLKTEPGGDFLIAPDSQSLVMLQGQGTAIIPLDEAAERLTEPLDFLPNYGRVFDLSRDGSAAAMVNFNQNDPEQRYTESLFLVTNQGEETELMQVSGTVMDAQFDPTNRILYSLTSELLPGEEYVEQPVLSAVSLKEKTVTDLLLLPTQQNITMSLAPDGLALLLNFEGALSVDGEAPPPEVEATSNSIWLLPLFTTAEARLQAQSTQNQPEPMPFKGVQAAWLP
ncbi:MAG TPA: hypothetical protein V6D06_18845 [Trichocoleus sp.]